MVQRKRHSLTLGFRQEEDDDDDDDEEDSTFIPKEKGEETISSSSFSPQERELIKGHKEGRALSEPLLDLRYLASTMILVKNAGGLRPYSTRKYHRRDSCAF